VWVIYKCNKVVRRAVIPRKCYSVKIGIIYLAWGANIKYGKDNILADIASYSLIINIEHIKYARILYNPQVLLVIA
jgi:hypothetical protein